MRTPEWTPEAILKALQRAARNSVAPPSRFWSRSTPEHPSAHQVKSAFGSYTAAVHRAGLKTRAEAKEERRRAVRGSGGARVQLSAAEVRTLRLGQLQAALDERVAQQAAAFRGTA
jgi:hypothetical protein